MIYIIDALFHVRRELERDVTGRAPRRIINDMLATQAGDVNIWCWDGAGAKKRRQAIFPAYKSKRLPHPDNIWPMVNLLREGLAFTPSVQITVPTYEADDVIATIVRAYPVTNKHIRSQDRDLSQLFDGHTSADFTTELPPDDVRLYKTLVGDASDNIPGVKLFGQKGWAQLTPQTKHQLKAAFNGGDARVVAMTAEQLPTAATRNWFG